MPPFPCCCWRPLAVPARRRKGLPAYFWAAAQESYAAGDYLKTLDHLDGILDSDSEYTARAVPWSLLLSSGLANGYADLADHYQAGGKKNKEAPGNFFKFVGSYRSQAGRLTLRFADNFAKYGNLKGDSVTMAFNFPPGATEPVGQLETVAAGNLLPASVADQAETRALQRGIILAMARALGSPDDVAKAQEALKANQGKIAHNMYMIAMANCPFRCVAGLFRARVERLGKGENPDGSRPRGPQASSGILRDERPGRQDPPGPEGTDHLSHRHSRSPAPAPPGGGPAPGVFRSSYGPVFGLR